MPWGEVPASACIVVAETGSEIRARPFDRLPQRVFADTTLPALCVKCAKPAEEGREWHFVGPLPKATRWLFRAIPILVVGFVIALVLAAAVAPEMAGMVVALGGPVGVILGLLMAQGMFRRSRNVLTIYLCPEHLRDYERLCRRRRRARAVMIAVAILVIVVGSQVVLFTWLGRRWVSLPMQLAAYGGVPGLLAWAVVYDRLAAGRLGAFLEMDVSLSADERSLFLRGHSPIVEQVAAAKR